MDECFLPTEMIVRIMDFINYPKTYLNLCLTCSEISRELQKINYCLYRYICTFPEESLTHFKNNSFFKEKIMKDRTLLWYLFYLLPEESLDTEDKKLQSELLKEFSPDMYDVYSE